MRPILQNVQIFATLLIATLVIVFTTTCRKANDNIKPTIEITFPQGSPSFNVLDTIFVNVSVTDDRQIDFVSLKLTRTNGSVAATGSNWNNISGTSVTLGGSITINNIHLESGQYFIAATAGDGENESVSFKEVYVNELQLQREAILAFTRPSETTLQVDSINSQGPGVATTINSDFTFAAANSWDQTLMLTGDNSNGITVLTYPDFEVIQQLPPLNDANTTYYNGLHYSESEHKYFVTSRDRRISRYGGSGNQELNTLSSDPFYPYEIGASELHIFVEEANITGLNRRLAVYQNNTGAFLFGAFTQLDITEILPLHDGTALIAGNDNEGNGHILFYYPDGNNFDEINSTLPDGAISDLCQVNGSNFIIAHQEGLFRYSTNNNNIYNLSPGINSSDVEFDKANTLIIAAEENEVHLINYTNGVIIFTHSFSNQVEAVEVMYNK